MHQNEVVRKKRLFSVMRIHGPRCAGCDRGLVCLVSHSFPRTHELLQKISPAFIGGQNCHRRRQLGEGEGKLIARRNARKRLIFHTGTDVHDANERFRSFRLCGIARMS